MAPRKDVALRITVPLVVAAHGGKQRIEIPTTSPCRDCGGEGGAPGAERVPCAACDGRGKQRATDRQLAIDVSCRACGGRGHRFRSSCASCGGRGEQDARNAVELTIPPGVADGATLRL